VLKLISVLTGPPFERGRRHETVVLTLHAEFTLL